MGTRLSLWTTATLALLSGCTFDTTGLRPTSRDGKPAAETTSAEASVREMIVVDRPPDHPLPGDAGCPSGLTPCGNVCIDTTISLDHCGGCGKPCAAGLDCKAGSCVCVVGGRCTGCCDKGVCRLSTPAACGTGGAACESCDDKNGCTTDSCSAGVCNHKDIVIGAFCDDGKFCTTFDGCLAGVCFGGPQMKCPDADACHLGDCDEAADKCVQKVKPDHTSCGRGGRECINGSCVKP